MEYSSAHRLAQDIRNSEEYRTYHALKETVNADETTAALLREYRKLSVKLQMQAMSGQSGSEEDRQRFQGITALLFAGGDVQRFLLSEMRLQQALCDIFKIITEAAELEISLPDISA